MIKDGRIILLRSFWGHKAGTHGRIRNGKLRLKGSQPATVTTADLDNLFRYVN